VAECRAQDSVPCKCNPGSVSQVNMQVIRKGVTFSDNREKEPSLYGACRRLEEPSRVWEGHPPPPVEIKGETQRETEVGGSLKE
jgi:hypothetical protein